MQGMNKNRLSVAASRQGRLRVNCPGSFKEAGSKENLENGVSESRGVSR